MARLISLFIVAMMLSGCDSIEKNTRNMRYNIDKSYDNMRHLISDAIYKHKEEGELRVAPRINYDGALYCYEVASDVLCYREPQEDMRNRFIAMQGADGSYYSNVPLYDYRYMMAEENISTKQDDIVKTTDKKDSATSSHDNKRRKQSSSENAPPVMLMHRF